MNPQYLQNRFRAWTGNPLVAIVLTLLLSAQTTIAMPHAHPADHDPVATEQTADHSARGHHHPDATAEKTSGSGHDHESRDCCEIECQDCTMGSCSSVTQSRGPGLFNDNRDRRLATLDRLVPEPVISGLYRPPISC